MARLRSLLLILAMCALAINFQRCWAGKSKQNKARQRTRPGKDRSRNREQNRNALVKFSFPTLSPDPDQDVIVSVVRISKRVPLGAIFDSSLDGVLRIFQRSMSNYSEVNAYVDVIHTADAYKLSRLMCRHFGRNAWMMYGSVSPDSFVFLRSISSYYSLPFITPWHIQKDLPRNNIDALDYAISLRGDYHRAIIDTIKYYGWRKIIYMYDSDDGLMRLQQIFNSLPNRAAPFQITIARRVTNLTVLMDTIRELERSDRFGEKYVVLDCSMPMVKFILVYHSQNDENTKHTFHYFLIGLQLLEVAASENFLADNSVNVTGLSVIDKTAAATIDNRWNYNLMTGDEALALDAVKVLIDTVLRFREEGNEKKMIFKDQKKIQCDPINGSFYASNHGYRLLELIKQTDLNGVTGKVKFDEDGSRVNFTLQVIEKQPNGGLAKIASWYDYKGLVPVPPKVKHVALPPSFDRNRTYTITTIAEAPYYMEEKSDYPRGGDVIRDGFCYDLTVLIVQKLGIKYEMRLVRDKDYGTQNPGIVGGWTGMMGEIVRKEADMAIAPLTVTAARERDVDFSQPFLSFDLRTFARSRLYNMSLFLRPLSGNVWLAIASSLPLVVVILYIIARLSSSQWRRSTSLCQAIWFTLKSLLRHGNESAPRFASGIILGIIWWTYVFFVISCYTANLSSILTVLRTEDLLIRGSDKSCGGSSYPVGLKLPPNDSVINNVGWFRSLFLAAPADQLAQTPCELVLSDEEDGIKKFAIAVTKKSDLREAVNLALTSLRQEGEIQKLVKKWFSITACRDEIIEEFSQSELRFSDMAGIFMILGGGLIVASIVAIVEVLYRRRKQLSADRPEVESVDDDIELEERPSPQHTATCRRSRLRWSDEPYPIDISDDIPELPESVTRSGRSRHDTPRRASRQELNGIEAIELYHL